LRIAFARLRIASVRRRSAGNDDHDERNADQRPESRAQPWLCLDLQNFRQRSRLEATPWRNFSCQLPREGALARRTCAGPRRLRRA
jgi:hypothetical protein